MWVLRHRPSNESSSSSSTRDEKAEEMERKLLEVLLEGNHMTQAEGKGGRVTTEAMMEYRCTRHEFTS